MQKTTLYQLDSKGNTKLWSIEVINHGQRSEILSFSGLLNGKHTPDSTIITEGKNTGKANETNHYTQACGDAQTKLNAKLKKGYVEDLSQVQASAVLGSGVAAPMLAQKYDPTQKQSSSKNLKRIGIEGKQVYVQRKKDGNRGNIKVTQNSIALNFRSGDKVPMNGIEHISDSLLTSFQKIYKYVNEKYGVTEYTLDGEFYTKACSFNKMNGILKKEDKTADDLAVCKHIKFHLYDVMLPYGYETRYKIVKNFKSPSVWVEEAIEITATEAEILKWLEKFLEEGEEGLMIRQLGMPYENKRTWQLCKYKAFEDAEFEVVGFEESSKGGMVGAVILKMTKPSADRAGNPITTFKAGLSFSHEECAEMWNNQSKYIGQFGTVEYFGVSEYNVPRFPKFKAFRTKKN